MARPSIGKRDMLLLFLLFSCVVRARSAFGDGAALSGRVGRALLQTAVPVRPDEGFGGLSVRIKTAVSFDACVQVGGSSPAVGSPLVDAPCMPLSMQYFYIVASGVRGRILIKTSKNGLCIAASASATEPTARLALCNSTDPLQAFSFMADPLGGFQLYTGENVSEQCLQLLGDGVNMLSSSCPTVDSPSNLPHASFKFYPLEAPPAPPKGTTAPAPGLTVTVRTGLMPRGCLQVNDKVVVGAIISQRGCSGSPLQNFYLESAGPDPKLYLIKTSKNGLCLSNGVTDYLVLLAKCNSQDPLQQFAFVSDGLGGYQIRVTDTSTMRYQSGCLGVPGNYAGLELQRLNCYSAFTSEASFRLGTTRPVLPSSGSTVRIKTGGMQNGCLQVGGSSPAVGSSLVQTNCAALSLQFFYLESAGRTGKYLIRTSPTGLCISASASTANPVASLAPCNSQDRLQAFSFAADKVGGYQARIDGPNGTAGTAQCLEFWGQTAPLDSVPCSMLALNDTKASFRLAFEPPAGPIPSGLVTPASGATIMLRSGLMPNFCLQVRGLVTVGASVFQQPCSVSPLQNFYLQSAGPEHYLIKTSPTGLCISNGVTGSPSTLATLATCNSQAPLQQFAFVSDGLFGYQIRVTDTSTTKFQNGCLGVPGISAGLQLQRLNCNSADYVYGSYKPTVTVNNLALRRPTFASSVGPPSPSPDVCCDASYVVDGNLTTIFNSAYANTSNVNDLPQDFMPWVAIKLDSVSQIYSVVIYNRVGFTDRLQNAEIRVGSISPLNDISSNPVVWWQNGNLGNAAEITFKNPAVGSWVTLQNKNPQRYVDGKGWQNVLNIREIKVMGVPFA